MKKTPTKKAPPFSLQQLFSPQSLSKNTPASLLGLVILILGLIIVSFLVKQQQDLRGRASAADVDLSLIPATASVQPNQNLTLNIHMNTHARQVTAAQLQVNFDSNLFSFVSFALGDTLDDVVVSGASFGNSAYFTLGVKPVQIGPNEFEVNPFTGTGTLAVLTLKAKSTETTTSVSFQPGSTSGAAPSGTIVTEFNSPNTDVAGDLNSSNVTIGTPTATSTPSPTNTPRPTNTPGPSPTSGPVQGDINGDGKVNSLDYVILFENFRKSSFDPRADINNDGKVNSLDYVILFENFNP